jgi:RNA polymerase sigma-70 factor (ECF subfamily)
MSLQLAKSNDIAHGLLEEQALLAGLRAGEERAFETLVREQTRRLLPMARRFLGSHEDARDAVQETLVAALQSIETFRGEARLSTWIRHIGVNQCLMMLRKRRRHPEVAIEPLLPKFDESGHMETPCEKWESAPDLLEQSETQALVRKLIDELPETYRSVLLLRDIEELSTEEVASLLAVSRTAVKVRLHRARQALRTLLEPHVRKGCV